MKAQASVEYLMVLALIALIVVPTTYLFYTHTQSSNERIRESQVYKLGNDIINNAENIYYLGAPSRITIQGTMPEGVKDIVIMNNELIIYLEIRGKTAEYVFISSVGIAGSFTQNAFSPGTKNVIIEAIDTTPPYVQITIT